MSAVMVFVSSWSSSKAAGNSWNSSLPAFFFKTGLKRGVLLPISLMNRSYASDADWTTNNSLATEPSMTFSILLKKLRARDRSSVTGSSPTSGGRWSSSLRVISSCSCSSSDTPGRLRYAWVQLSCTIARGKVPLQDKIEQLLSQGSWELLRPESFLQIILDSRPGRRPLEEFAFILPGLFPSDALFKFRSTWLLDTIPPVFEFFLLIAHHCHPTVFVTRLDSVGLGKDG